jgi:hypothetical protein
MIRWWGELGPQAACPAELGGHVIIPSGDRMMELSEQSGLWPQPNIRRGLVGPAAPSGGGPGLGHPKGRPYTHDEKCLPKKTRNYDIAM